MRRNIVVSGLNLNALKARRVAVGAAVLEVTTICAPCSRMEETFGTGGYSAVRGHGGWCARVIVAGAGARRQQCLPQSIDTMGRFGGKTRYEFCLSLCPRRPDYRPVGRFI